MDNLKFCICEDISNWDKELLTYEYPHPFQSVPFTQYFHKRGYNQFYFHIILDGDVIGHCCVSIMHKKIAAWYYGPVIKKQFRDKYNDIVSKLKQFLLKKGIACFDNVKTQIFYDNVRYERDRNLYSRVCHTPFIDLRRSLEEVNSSFDNSVRKNIKKCEKAGVEVIITNEPWAAGPYLQMLSYHRLKLGLKMPPFYPDLENLKSFSGSYVSMDIALASLKGTYLAAIGFIKFGKIFTEIGLGQSEAYSRMKLPIHDLIKVKAIEIYKKKGFEVYDLAGIEMNPKNQKEHNIRRFKLKFSKDIAEYAIIRNRGLSYLQYFKYKIMHKIKHKLFL